MGSMLDIVNHLRSCTTLPYKKTTLTFGFTRLQAILDGEWDDPADFLERLATVTYVRGTNASPCLTFSNWQRLAMQSTNRIPDDALTALLACNLYNKRHLRRSFAQDYGTMVHQRLLLCAIGHAGGGWRSGRYIATRRSIAGTLVQDTFEPTTHPRIPDAVLETIAPPTGHQNPLEACVARTAQDIWSALQIARPDLTIIGAEIEATLASHTFETCSNSTKRYLSPRLDAIAADRKGDLWVIDYKTSMQTAARPTVYPCYLAQLLVHALCLSQCAQRQVMGCILVIAMRDHTVHLVQFPYCRDRFIDATLRRVIGGSAAFSKKPTQRVTEKKQTCR